MTFRKFPRDVHEDARDTTRALMGTPEFAKSHNQRKKVETRFAHLKTHHGLERMRLRGLSGARYEFHLAAIVQNLKTLANYIWRPLLSTPMRRLSLSGLQPRAVAPGCAEIASRPSFEAPRSIIGRADGARVAPALHARTCRSAS